MNYIFYHITSASLLVTGWHIVWYTFYVQYKPDSSTFLIPVITPTSRRVQLHSLFTPAAWPSGFILPPNPLQGSWHLCAEGPLHPRHTFHWPHCTPVVCTHPESWQMEHFCILYFKLPSYITMLLLFPHWTLCPSLPSPVTSPWLASKAC